MDLLEELNEEQQDAVATIDGPMLVLAGAGSGKTRVVTYRIAHLIKQGVPPSQILGLTFTNKAAKEMKERIISLTNHRVLISTFHSLGARILRESYHPNFTIYDEQDADKLLKSCIADLYPEQKKLEPKPIKALISKSKNALLAPHQVETKDPKFPKIYQLYQERLEAYNALDFDDLLYVTVRLFEEKSDVLKQYQDRWKYLLIDEYQDTNVAQYTLISQLIEQSQNLCVVGDPDQSIYSWRGANFRNILNFAKDYPKTKVVRLEQNYRSHTNILEAANALISNNDERYEKELWSDLGPGEKIKCYQALDERDEAQFVAEQVSYYHDYEAIPLSQMAIFYRTNAQSRVFEDALLAQRIPYTIIGGISFYQRKEIKDILAYLRVVQSDADFVSFARTINLPKRGIGEATVEKIRQHADRPIIPYCQALLSDHPPLKLSARHLKGLQEYLSIITDLRKMEGPVSDIVQACIEQTHYQTLLAEDPDSYDDRKENLDSLLAKAIEWEGTLEAFLEELSLKTNLDEMDASEDKLNLMTLHNAKGLEFQTTFLTGLEEDLFPHVNSRGTPEAVEEERRLCYVGVTRAKKHLYLTHSSLRFMWGYTRNQRPSRFLREIPLKFKETIY